MGDLPERVLVRHAAPRVSQPKGALVTSAATVATGADAVSNDEGHGIQPEQIREGATMALYFGPKVEKMKHGMVQNMNWQ